MRRFNAYECAEVYTACFQNGFLYAILPENKEISLYDDSDRAYQASIIISDGKKYMVADPCSISTLPVPVFSTCYDTTSSLDYILRMCASNLRNAKLNEQSIVVLRKALQLMRYSRIDWAKKDFRRIVAWLYEDRRIIEGDQAFLEIDTLSLVRMDYNEDKQYLFDRRYYALLQLLHGGKAPMSFTAFYQSRWKDPESYKATILELSRNENAILQSSPQKEWVRLWQ